jgi:hypothetical protein
MLLNLLRAGVILGLLLCVVLPTFAQCVSLFNHYDTLIIGEQGSGYILTASSKDPFTAKSDVPWLSLSQSGHSITVTSMQSNNTLSQRIGHVIISQAGRCPEAITVVQPGKICTRVDGTPGRKFWAAFLENMHPNPTISLNFASLTAASGTITNPNTGWASSFTVPAKDIRTVHIPEAQAYNTVGEDVTNKAIYIETSANVSVYALNFQHQTSDAAVILPVEALGDEYYSISFNGNKGSGGNDRTPEEFLIVATEDGTLVTIVPANKTGGGKPAGNPYTIRMRKGQSYLVKSDITGSTDSESNYVSITGSYIKSNKLIAVFAGHKRAHVGCRGELYRDHLFEQLLPLRLWGTQYLVVPTNLKEDLYRVLAAHDNTQFSINGVAQPSLNKGEYKDFSINRDQTAFIKADHPVSVALFTKSSNCTGLSTGDPFMIVLNPVQNMTKDLTFTPLLSGNITRHYVNITVKKQSNYLTSLVNEKTGKNIPLSFTDIPNQNYAYARVPIDVAPHSLKDEMGFTAYVYGSGFVDSYGYLVGAQFNHLQEPEMVRDTSYCINETPQPLSAFDGNNLLWYLTNDFENEKGSPVAPVFTTARPDTLVYYVSYLKECSESPRKKITISINTPVANPVVSIPHSPHGSTSFCAGEHDTLMVQAANAEIFEWYKNDQRIPGISGSTLTVMDPGTYHAKASTRNLCYALHPSNAIEVTVHELPGAPALSSTSICKNDIPAVPAASNGYTFLWYDKNHKPVGHPALQSGTIETTTYYIRQKEHATNCEGSAATWIYTVHDLPDVTVSGTPYFCTNSHTELTAAGAVDYLWSTGAASASISINAVETYSVTGTDHNGCKNTAQITISEKPLPAVTLALPDTTVCHGSSLWVKTLGNTTGTLTWNVASPVTINHSQYIIATATNECGNFSDSALVTHVPLPAVAPMDPLRTCENNEVILTVKSAIGDVHWSVSSTTFTAVSSGTYTAYATNFCGTASQTVHVTVVPLPRVVANNDTTVCYEREVTLGTRHHIGALRWNSPLTVKATGPQTYTVTASNECGMASDEMTVDVFTPIQFTVQNPLPPYTYKRFYEQELSFENAEHPVYLRWLGSLPEGMTITPDGILRGMPMTTGYNFNSHRFTLFLEDYRGCATAQEFLLPARFSAPNVIIRDGGENSHFLPDFDLEIYNRQGVLLHKGKGWLGTSGSSQVPRGTYFYKINIMQDGALHQYMGHINVLL